MGRKIKISFSNTDEDTSLAYLHDMGFIPKIVNGLKGFKVVVGGGLGAQPMLAYTAHEFLAEDHVIPFIESVLRVFDRHGERNSRHKARMKFLIQKIGFEEFMNLVQAETKALKNHSFPISDAAAWEVSEPTQLSDVAIPSSEVYKTWLATNTFEQKQKGFHGVYVRILNGNISSDTSRSLIDALQGYIGDDVRITINQGLLLKFVPTANLPYVFQTLAAHDLAAPGANSIANITACPGTDTCNLAISDSTNITSKLEQVINDEFPALIHDSQMKIKISGCMNACGQHSMASIGFHGSSLKAPDKRVLPALQVLLGGATLGNGEGRIADKVIKVPSKRGPEVLRIVLNNYEENANDGEYFHEYYDRLGENHFYTLIKPLADLSNLVQDDFIDWGASENFVTEIGVGECAGVMIDLVATLLFESQEKYEWTVAALEDKRWADAIYHAYSVFISAAKALLLDKSVTVSNQTAVINKFDENFISTGEFAVDAETFSALVLQINQQEPTEAFANQYVAEAERFLIAATTYRQNKG
jgi:sulfite reductase (ferredoxin)